MFWGKSKNKGKAEKRPMTINLRKKRSLLRIRTKKEASDETLKCIMCNKKINAKPIFCSQYTTRTKLCNTGPFCSDECWDKHLEHVAHY